MPEAGLGALDRFRPPILILTIFMGLGIGLLVPEFGEVSGPIIYLTLIGLIYSVTLGVHFGDVVKAFRNIRFFSVAWGQNFIIIPILAYGLGLLFLGPYPAIFVGFILYLVTPCTDWFLVFTGMAKGDVPLALALLPTNLILQVVLLPLYLWLFAGETIPFQAGAFMETIIVFIILPFALAGLTRWALARRRTEVEKERILDRWVTPLQMATLVIVIFAMFAGNATVIVDNSGQLSLVFLPVIIFFGISFVIAQVLSSMIGLRYGERALLTVTTAARNSPLGLAIAVGLFPDQPLLQVAIIIGVLIELPLLILVVRGLLLIRKRSIAST
jgi:ACR3 family arsenite efflux pump ArsB